MKYMGSKRAMLENGLGGLLRAESESASRVVDLFCGAAFVSWFAATNLGKPVVAVDLQRYAAVLAGCVVKRTKPTSVDSISKLWLYKAMSTRARFKNWREASALDGRKLNTASWRKRAQHLCESDMSGTSPLVWRCYGGHYFSPIQALSFDAMLRTLPEEDDLRDLCLAATIIAASHCAASPGHTAQPFKATRTAAPYLREAWLRDPFAHARQALMELCPLHAARRGEALTADANEAATRLRSDDLVFVDPPYSAVHYSRFYHVLETIARGECSAVSGVGRYPPPSERPNSAFSRKDKARTAMQSLLETLSERGCTVVLTFPKNQCSNGLSGREIESTARHYFDVTKRSVKTRFSTLGGNTSNRVARQASDELMLVLKP